MFFVWCSLQKTWQYGDIWILVKHFKKYSGILKNGSEGSARPAGPVSPDQPAQTSQPGPASPAIWRDLCRESQIPRKRSSARSLIKFFVKCCSKHDSKPREAQRPFSRSLVGLGGLGWAGLAGLAGLGIPFLKKYETRFSFFWIGSLTFRLNRNPSRKTR